LTRAIWRLGDNAPATLKKLNRQMIFATDKGAKAQQLSLIAFD
jgi:hypothetical protein